MANPLFRQTAIERLSSPERLDTLIQVTTARAWLALAAMIMVIAAALLWGIRGRTSETFGGPGILLPAGGLFDIETEGTGVITDYYVKLGDHVKQGQMVARLAQPDLEEQIRQVKARLGNVRKHGGEATALIAQNRILLMASLKDQIGKVEQSRTATRQYVAYLEERLRAQSEALKQGLVTREAYENTVQQLATAQQTLVAAEAEIKALGAQQASLENQTTQSIFTLDQDIETLQQQLELLQQQYERSAFVKSAYDGRVVEFLADEGQLVAAGRSLINLELTGSPLVCLVFVPLVGQLVQQGMTVHVSPDGISWEEYGYIIGRVRSVSATPLSPMGMTTYLHNETLVQQFSGQGGAYLVEVDLEKDGATLSGFKWSARSGSTVRVGTGMLLSATIVTREHAPITLVIPALRKWLGV
jgi:HlyD family secretion protein